MAAASGLPFADEDEVDNDDLPGLGALSAGAPEAVVGPSGWVFRSKSFGLRVSDWPRDVFIRFVEWPPFDTFVLMTILANCVTMASVSPIDPPTSWKVGVATACEVRVNHI